MQTVFALFDIFSKNLAFYKPKYKGHFMCPLCLRRFSRDQINSDLSVAHIVPQFLGGKVWTLCCKTCNNKVGSEIESCESQRAKSNWALSGDGNETIRAESWLSSEQEGIIGPVQADIGVKTIDGERRLQINLKPQVSNPKASKLLNDRISDKKLTGDLSLEFDYHITKSSKRANLTYVHIAYMFMFHQFGYEWVFSPGAELIRKQIISPDEQIILPQSPALSDFHIPNDNLAILFIKKPADFRNFLLVLPLIRGWKRRHALWLPLFGSPYKQPPHLKDIKLVYERVHDHHQFLGKRESQWQGYRLIIGIT